MNRPIIAVAALALAAGVALPVAAQTKWDLPSAYPASNFHTENLQQFANDVDKATGGKLKITVHANASLFKANEIKRAVQGGQAQIGEVLLVNSRTRTRSTAPTACRSWPRATPMRRSSPPRRNRCSTSCSARRA